MSKGYSFTDPETACRFADRAEKPMIVIMGQCPETGEGHYHAVTLADAGRMIRAGYEPYPRNTA